MSKMIATVTINGQAWFAEPIGSDPHYTTDSNGMEYIRNHAKVSRCGRGYRVELTGEVDDLLRLSRWLDNDGQAWLLGCGPEQKPEARACIRAAKQIREQLTNHGA